MTPDFLAVARRAVACPKWRWMPGMLTVPSEGVWTVTPPLRLTDERRLHYPDEYDWPHDLGLRLPDLTDPATRGCLYTLVREAWGSDRCFCRQEDTPAGAKWFVLCPTPKRLTERIGAGWHGPFEGDTEVEALVAALETWQYVEARMRSAYESRR